MGERGQSRYVVVALFDPIGVGASISRMRWPAHVTIVSNFVTAATVDDIDGAIRRAAAHDEPIVVELEGRALFGPNRDIPVLLVRPGRINELHERFADALEPLGVVVDQPAYWREGYRPHLTLGPAVEADEGETRVAAHLAIARLDAGSATVLALIGLPADSTNSSQE